jgi:CubicO group peptidase (beta-lactamase class C family)
MPVRPETVGLSSSRLERLDDYLDRKYVRTGKLPGTLTLVARRGELAHVGVRGMADCERAKALAEDTIFRIYSMTKPVTSVAFMMLVEEGLVALDDPVHRFIPEWKGMGVFAGGTHEMGFQTTPTLAPMRMVDLLRHTAGLTYGFQMRSNIDAAYRKGGWGMPEKRTTLEDMIQGLAKVPLEFSPGEAWIYSVATDVLGYLVGKISGMPFERFLQERIFDVLGMEDTGFFVPPEKHHRLAACYSWTPENPRKLVDDPASGYFREMPPFVSGGGGLVSTAHDYLLFCQALLDGGRYDGGRLLSRKTIELMTANHLPGGVDLPAVSRSLFSEATYAGVGFGLGFATTIDPAKTLIPGSAGDFFWGGMASTFFWIDPKEELIGIFMTQLMPSSTYPVRRELRTMVYSAIND